MAKPQTTRRQKNIARIIRERMDLKKDKLRTLRKTKVKVPH